MGASPGLTAGRGLKPGYEALGLQPDTASPGLTAGRGLKLDPGAQVRGNRGHRPASRPGAD